MAARQRIGRGSPKSALAQQQTLLPVDGTWPRDNQTRPIRAATSKTPEIEDVRAETQADGTEDKAAEAEIAPPTTRTRKRAVHTGWRLGS